MSYFTYEIIVNSFILKVAAIKKMALILT